MSIQPLPPNVIAQIKSSITITSLNGVVGELVKNALDAGATKVDISVDYSRGGCSVEDDGLGILPSEFQVDGHLGKLYHSSKLNAQTPVHGGRGTFLACLSALALVSITSHHHLYRSHNTLMLHKSEVASRQTPAPLQQHLVNHHGTRVTIRDLFGNMPVRLKQRAMLAGKERGNSKDWETLKKDVIGLLLPWPRAVAVTLRDSQTNYKLSIRPSSMPTHSGRLSSSSLCNILAQASFISRDRKTSWISVQASTPQLDIGGSISIEPAATKHVQFLSLGIWPVVYSEIQSVFHDEINRLFSNSAFGVEEQADEIKSVEQDRGAKAGRYKGDGYTNKELKGVKKGVDRWPMFFINIQLSDPRELRSGVEDILDDNKPSLTGILELLRALILEFLTKNHFRPKVGRSHGPNKDEVRPPVTSSPETVSKFSFKPGPTRVSRAKGNWPSTKTNHSSDSFGPSVRLPSFRKGVPFADSPFDFWSRVKQGTISRPVTPKILAEDAESSKILRPGTAPPSLSEASSIKRISTPRRSNVQPLISKAGKILRAPFDDVTLPTKLLSDPLLPLPPPKPSPGKASSDGDDLMSWINPITKVETFINQRTGLTMRSTSQSSYNNQALRLTACISSHNPPKGTPSPWIRDLLETWDNPVFAPAQQSIPQISFDGLDVTTQNFLHGLHRYCSDIDLDRAFKEVSFGIGSRISKNALRHAEIVSQVDQKFILVKLQPSRIALHSGALNMLVLIDQHAADERIRVEALMGELCTAPQTDPAEDKQSGILTAALANPLLFDLCEREIQLLKTHHQHFFNWGVLYNIHSSTPKSSSSRLTVHSLPPSILERCQSCPRLLIDLIRTELWKIHDKPSVPAPPLPQGDCDWLQRIHTCPQGILDMINSRACRSAIMFNDVLTKKQCEALVRRLAECKFPFQCAHGRPSLVPLVDLEALELRNGMQREEEGGFGQAFGRWKESLE